MLLSQPCLSRILKIELGYIDSLYTERKPDSIRLGSIRKVWHSHRYTKSSSVTYICKAIHQKRACSRRRRILASFTSAGTSTTISWGYTASAESLLLHLRCCWQDQGSSGCLNVPLSHLWLQSRHIFVKDTPKNQRIRKLLFGLINIFSVRASPSWIAGSRVVFF